MMLVVLAGNLCAQADTSGMVTLFPSRRLVETPIADGSAHRFAIEKSFKVDELWGAIGGVIPVLETSVLGYPSQVSMAASAHMVLDPGVSIAVMSTEYYVDFFMVDVLWSEHWFTRVGMGHTSHHLGDDADVDLLRNVHDYSRDYVATMGGYTGSGVRAYAGANYGYGFVIDRPVSKHWLLQAGGEITFLRLSEDCSGFFAGDVKVRQELAFGTTQNFRAGIQFQRSGRSLRVVLSYKTGLEERGQFYPQRRSFGSAGLLIDF